jgi:hypothetical protein
LHADEELKVLDPYPTRIEVVLDASTKKLLGCLAIWDQAVEVFNLCSMLFRSEMSIQLHNFGFDGYKVILIAVEELISALLFLTPSTRHIGVLLVLSAPGRSFRYPPTAHAVSSSFAPAAMVLALAWFGTWLRHPAIFFPIYQPTT